MDIMTGDLTSTSLSFVTFSSLHSWCSFCCWRFDLLSY